MNSDLYATTVKKPFFNAGIGIMFGFALMTTAILILSAFVFVLYEGKKELADNFAKLVAQQNYTQHTIDALMVVRHNDRYTIEDCLSAVINDAGKKDFHVTWKDGNRQIETALLAIQAGEIRMQKKMLNCLSLANDDTEKSAVVAHENRLIKAEKTDGVIGISLRFASELASMSVDNEAKKSSDTENKQPITHTHIFQSNHSIPISSENTAKRFSEEKHKNKKNNRNHHGKSSHSKDEQLSLLPYNQIRQVSPPLLGVVPMYEPLESTPIAPVINDNVKVKNNAIILPVEKTNKPIITIEQDTLAPRKESKIYLKIED